MAIIVGAFGGGQIKGKLSGNVFQGNKYGQLIRNWVKPVNPNSAGQVTTRTSMQMASLAWLAALTPEQRQGWQDYADGTPIPDRFGNNHVIGGRNMFLRSNVARISAGISQLFAPPPTPGVATSTIPTFTADDTDGIVIDSMDGIFEVGALFQISLSIPVNPTRNYYAGPFRTGINILQTDTYPFELKPATEVQQNQRYFARYRYFAPDGKVSNATIVNLGDII